MLGIEKQDSVLDNSEFIETKTTRTKQTKFSRDTLKFSSFIKPMSKEKSSNGSRLIIYPENTFRKWWELFITIVLLYSCCATPYHLAFDPEDTRINSLNDVALDQLIVDSLFLIDLVLNFFFAYYDKDFNIIDDRKKIAVIYLKSWFFVDFFAIFPFDIIFQVGQYNSMTRILKLPKLYKLIKMTRLVRMLKIVKERSKLVKYLQELLKIGVGFERLLFFISMFLVLSHIVACLWIFASRFEGNYKEEDYCLEHYDNWICIGEF